MYFLAGLPNQNRYAFFNLQLQGFPKKDNFYYFSRPIMAKKIFLNLEKWSSIMGNPVFQENRFISARFHCFPTNTGQIFKR